MNVLIIGSGGREHALAWSIARSPLLTRLWIVPGNPGTARCGTNVGLDVCDHAGIVAFCRDAGIDLVVVGPEAPLVAGLADDLAATPASPTRRPRGPMSRHRARRSSSNTTG